MSDFLSVIYRAREPKRILTGKLLSAAPVSVWKAKLADLLSSHAGQAASREMQQPTSFLFLCAQGALLGDVPPTKRQRNI